MNRYYGHDDQHISRCGDCGSWTWRGNCGTCAVVEVEVAA